VMMKTDDESDEIHSVKPCGQLRHLSERTFSFLDVRPLFRIFIH